LCSLLSGVSAPAAAAATKPSFQVVIDRKEIVGCVQSGGSCLKDARAVRYVVDGKVLGWKLLEIKRGSLFEKLKFRNGDIVLSANGETVTDAARIPFWMIQIVTVKSVELDILRGGKALKIDCQVKD
jgi:type II secretory pathway component PulC